MLNVKNNLLAELKTVLLKYPCSRLFQCVRLIISLSHSWVRVLKGRDFYWFQWPFYFQPQKWQPLGSSLGDTLYLSVRAPQSPVWDVPLFGNSSHVPAGVWKGSVGHPLHLPLFFMGCNTPEQTSARPKMEQGSLEAEVSIYLLFFSSERPGGDLVAQSL